jgi:hypothetical protein
MPITVVAPPFTTGRPRYEWPPLPPPTATTRTRSPSSRSARWPSRSPRPRSPRDDAARVRRRDQRHDLGRHRRFPRRLGRDAAVRPPGRFATLPPGAGCGDVVPFCGRARLWSAWAYLACRTRAARPRLGRRASCVADASAPRPRARTVADAAPNVRRSAGPSDPIVSSTGTPAMCASGIIGRSPWCSRRLGGAPRGRARGRWGGCGSRRRSRGRPASHRRASS